MQRRRWIEVPLAGSVASLGGTHGANRPSTSPGPRATGLLTLEVTPQRKVTGWHALVRFRRMLRLCAFSYGTVQVSSYWAFAHEGHYVPLLRPRMRWS